MKVFFGILVLSVLCTFLSSAYGAAVDCAGTPGGDKVYDACGVCGGNGTSCCENFLGIESQFWDFILLPEALEDMISRLQNSYDILEYVNNNLPEEGDKILKDNAFSVGGLVALNRDFLQDCGLVDFCDASAQFNSYLKQSI